MTELILYEITVEEKKTLTEWGRTLVHCNLKLDCFNLTGLVTGSDVFYN